MLKKKKNTNRFKVGKGYYYNKYDYLYPVVDSNSGRFVSSHMYKSDAMREAIRLNKKYRY